MMILCAFSQAFSFGTTSTAVVASLCFWRFFLGLGVGGDYPMSAVIMSGTNTCLSTLLSPYWYYQQVDT